MSFRTVLLDLDGTVVDAFTTIHRSYVHTLPLFGRPVPTMAQVRAAVGGGLANAMSHFLPPELIPAAMKVHLAYSLEILLEDVKLMPGTLELVQALHARGVTLAVFTNKHGPSSRRVCAHLGLDPYLTGNFAAGDTPWFKPQPEFAAHTLTALKAEAVTTLLIGDSPFDVQAAHNGRFACWCVTTGTHSAEELQAAGAERVFADLSALGRDLLTAV
jgi:phosphoglycolate phosphatase